jgi:hypothetical protein
MRGFLESAVRHTPSETQTAVRALARSRRNKLAKIANTTLIKVDQWARGAASSAEVSQALEAAFGQLKTKKK